MSTIDELHVRVLMQVRRRISNAERQSVKMQRRIVSIGVRKTVHLIITIAIFDLAGCAEDKAGERDKLMEIVADARIGAVDLKTNSPSTLLGVNGQVTDDGQGGITWETPGTARFNVEVAYDQEVDLASLRVRLFANGAQGQPGNLGRSTIEAAIQEGGKLTLVLQHDVLAKFETHGRMSLQIAVLKGGELHEIANVPFRGTFE